MSKKLRNDLILIALLIIPAALILALGALRKPGRTCQITVDGEIFAEADLKTDALIDVDGLLKVRIEGGKARVLDPACKNKLCSAHPPISASGETIICAPGGVVVKILGQGPDFTQ